MKRIEVAIKQVLADYTNKSADEIKLTDSLAELGLDSLAVVKCVMELEDEFHIKIPDSVISHFKTVNDIYNYVLTRNITV